MGHPYAARRMTAEAGSYVQGQEVMREVVLIASAEVKGLQNPSVKAQKPAQDLCLSPRQTDTLLPSLSTLAFFLASGSPMRPLGM